MNRDLRAAGRRHEVAGVGDTPLIVEQPELIAPRAQHEYVEGTGRVRQHDVLGQKPPERRRRQGRAAPRGRSAMTARARSTSNCTSARRPRA